MATYKKSSPYFDTKKFGNFLDVMTYRKIPAYSTDVYYEVDPVYNMRPDLLAHDLYGDSNLWWVFAMRNPNVLKDPIFGFVTGTRIHIPKKETLEKALGV